MVQLSVGKRSADVMRLRGEAPGQDHAADHTRLPRAWPTWHRGTTFCGLVQKTWDNSCRRLLKSMLPRQCPAEGRHKLVSSSPGRPTHSRSAPCSKPSGRGRTRPDKPSFRRSLQSSLSHRRRPFDEVLCTNAGEKYADFDSQPYSSESGRRDSLVPCPIPMDFRACDGWLRLAIAAGP
jgi:hypothetical protein